MKTAFVTLSALLALAFLAACNGDEGTSPTASPTVTPSPIPQASPTSTPVPDVCQPNPDPATPDVVQVDTPSTGDSVSSPVPINGRIAAFEATFRVTIFRADGSIAGDIVAMSAEGQTLAPFTLGVPFSVSEATPACLWVYEESARDGSPIHVLQIPLTLLP
ncbi:MAG: Gmad2 immunoglobulin-like domain-containing protein [Candidatus Tectimicrobiota bacterium]